MLTVFVKGAQPDRLPLTKMPKEFTLLVEIPVESLHAVDAFNTEMPMEAAKPVLELMLSTIQEVDVLSEQTVSVTNIIMIAILVPTAQLVPLLTVQITNAKVVEQ
jgi:hypothetical protein